HQEGGDVPAKRGRPSMGKPEQIRLSEADKALAIELGKGVFSKGMRAALHMSVQAKNKQARYDFLESLADLLSKGLTPSEVPLDALHRRLKQLLATEARIAKELKKSANLSEDDFATASEIGDGDPRTGITIALSAARFLGTETVRKLHHHGSGHCK
ncbi:MAG: hypothetical protein U1E02_08430, partial [Hydrogenophaga sp.]|nr:hypothetical protein [Hydrogenophaga sp.]